MSAATTCPFCNAVIPETIQPVGGRMFCPRCDGAFPAKAGVPDTQTPAIDAEVERHRAARRANGRRSTLRFLAIGLALGALGAGIGLAIHFWNREPRQEQQTTNIETAKPVAPAAMPGLSYLPAGTDSVIAIQFRPLFEALPDNVERSPQALMNWIGMPRDTLTFLERALPLGLETIDQIVLGLKLKDGSLLKQIVLVVHANKAFDIDEMASRLKAKTIQQGEQTIYQTTGTPQRPLDLNFWAPNNRVLVVALEAKDIEPAREGIAHLSPRLVELLARDLTPDTYFWAVLDSERWEVLGLFLLGLAAEQRKAFEKLNISLSVVRTISLGVRTEPEPALTVWLELKSEQTAAEFRAYVTEQLKDEGKVAIGGAGNRVMLRTPVQAGELRDLLRKLLPRPEKK